MAVLLPDARASNFQAPKVSQGIASVNADPGRGAEQMGASMVASGADLSRASEIVAQANNVQDKQTALGSANKAQQTAMDLQFNPQTGFANTKGEQALGKQFIDKYSQQFDDQLQSIRNNLQNDNQRRYFDQHADVLKLQYQGSLLKHQAIETEKYNDQTDDSAIKLQLRSMATDPTNEIGFQTGMVQINGVIDSIAKRKGLPPEQVAELKGQYKDAAYTTRITAILDGVPGVTEANPRLAEAVFKQVGDQLSGNVKNQLAKQINAGVMDVDARDIARSYVEGNGYGLRADGTQKGKGFLGELKRPDGNVSTELSVGVNIDGKEVEIPTLVPTLTKAEVNHLLGGGEPTKEIMDKAVAHARDRIEKGKSPFASASESPASEPPTAAQLKVDLYQRAQAARAEAEQKRPGDPKFADAVEARTLSYGRLIISQQEAQEAGLRDRMVAGMRGPNPDGSQAPKTIDQFFAIPGMRQAYNGASEQVKTAVTDHFKNGGGDVPRTGETQNLLYQYMGMAANNREQFAQADLSKLIGKLPFADFDKLANLQLAARNRQDRDADKAANYQHALSLSLNYALKPLGISTPTPSTSTSKREQYDQFSGRLASWMDDFQAANKRPPNDKEIIAQAKNLTATLTVPGALWNSDKRGFQLTPEEEAKATVKLDEPNKARITQTLKNRYGFEPTESMVQQAAVYEKLYPANLERWRSFDQTMREYGKKKP